MIYQRIITSQHRGSTSASPLLPFIAENRGKPAQYPVSFKLNGNISTSSSGRNSGNRNAYTYEAICLVDANVTLHQVHVVKFNVDDGDTAEVSIKQDNRYLHTKTYTRGTRVRDDWPYWWSAVPSAGASGDPSELDTFDNEKAVIFHVPGVKINQGDFVFRFTFQKRNSDANHHVLIYSPSWQRKSDGYVEWWCKSSSTPFYGLQFTTNP